MEISVSEVDTGDVECHAQIDPPPGICLMPGLCTGSIIQVSAVAAVVGVFRRCNENRIGDFGTDLVRRTIQSYVYIEASVHRHYTQRQDVIAATERSTVQPLYYEVYTTYAKIITIVIRPDNVLQVRDHVTKSV